MISSRPKQSIGGQNNLNKCHYWKRKTRGNENKRRKNYALDDKDVFSCDDKALSVFLLTLSSA